MRTQLTLAIGSDIRDKAQIHNACQQLLYCISKIYPTEQEFLYREALQSTKS